MKHYKSLFILSIIPTLLIGCTKNIHHDPKDYVININWKDSISDFRILELGDIHFSQSDVYDDHFKVIDKTVKLANPNLIVLNGDCFTYADKHVVNLLFSHIDSYNISWTFTFGNHDDQGYYSDAYIARLLASKKYNHVLFKNIENDDVTGRSNFVINLIDNSGGSISSLYNVYLMDSHSYNFDYLAYDYIKQDQIDWFASVADYIKGASSDYVPSSLFMHIPTPEFYTAAELAEQGDSSVKVKLGSTDEWSGGPAPKSDLGLFEVFKNHGGKSITAAHEHINDSVINYQGVDLCFGVHSTDRIYKDNKKIGGQLMIVNRETRNLTFKNIKTTYNSEEAWFEDENI